MNRVATCSSPVLEKPQREIRSKPRVVLDVFYLATSRFFKSDICLNRDAFNCRESQISLSLWLDGRANHGVANSVVRLSPLLVHAIQYWHRSIDVVINSNYSFVCMKPMQPPDVLLQGSTPRDGRCEEQRIQSRVVKAFSNVLACGKEHSWQAIRDGTDLSGKRITLLLSHPAFHHKNVRHSWHEFLKQELQVIGTLGEQERKPSVLDCGNNIGDD